ncbi:MAG: helix-turn-helix transcriptional regulator [Methylococcales bacterium]
MLVNEKIRLIRETKGLTQEQVAEKLGMSPSSYGDIERGENDPKLSKLQKIAEILEMQLSELVDLNEKGTLNINFNKQGKNVMYISSSTTELKDKEIALQQREIELLNKMIALMEKQ